MKIEQVAKAFVKGKRASCHNAVSTGLEYRLHGNLIAAHKFHFTANCIVFDWCDCYTTTTANHINKILAAAGYTGRRVGYASARDGNQGSFIFVCGELHEIYKEKLAWNLLPDAET